ncbi:MAG: hypothetical protein KAS63_06395 [Candidatus Heimdallarchaeota archaeon]|nr:hypothetical protein [Candidatus Heimdallarchaeota archaeon]MCK4954972.1 hypothetical protein [Candidatus Heimdallarchaeota archaeon]
MSSERDKGDEFFSKFNFKEAFHQYLRAREVFFTEGKEEELREVEIKIARCFGLLGMKHESVDLLRELAEQTKERILIEDYYRVCLELAATLFSYGSYLEGRNCIEDLEEEVIDESNPMVFFRYWQTRAQLQIVYHNLSDARETVHFLMKKAKELGNDPYFYELQVLEAQIDAEEGDVLKAYTNIDEAFKFFKETPFERSAFEKKIILSQFVEDPTETINLIDEYLDRYKPEDIAPLVFNAQRIELELRSDQITPSIAIEKAERLLYNAESIEHLELAAKIKRLLAGLYQSTGDIKSSYKAFEEARKYFLSQEMEYEEAVTFFIFLPALLQFHSAKVLGIMGIFGGSGTRGKEFIEGIDLSEEIDRIKDVFDEYGDDVRSKMAQFFQISYKISMIGVGDEFQDSIIEIKALYKWMLDEGELHYSEMIGQFLELVKQMR